MRTTCLQLLSAIALTVSLAACHGASTGTPQRASDAPAAGRHPLVNCGRTLDIATPPARAVALSQSATETMLTLGLERRMVGTAELGDPILPRLKPAYDTVPVLAKEYPSLERLLDARPDFVYTTFSFHVSEGGVATRDRLARLGVPAYLSPRECERASDRPERLDFEMQYREIRDIAEMFGVHDRAEAVVAELQQRIDRVRPLTGVGRTLSFAWVYSGTSSAYLAGCCGAPSMMTAALGARNVFDDVHELWPAIGWEAILERDPDVLILADLTRGHVGDSAAAKVAFLERDPIASRLTAVRNRRYVVLPGAAMDPSIRNVDAVETIAEGLRRLGLVPST